MRILAALFALCLFAVMPLRADAAGLAQPAGPVVLTVHGKIGNANRGAVDAFDDAFFKFGNVGFDKGAAFDLAMLEKLGMKTLAVKYDTWPKAYRFEGPLLRDVLKAAGASGKSVKVYAIDGYGAEIPVAEIEKFDVLLALKADGKYLGLGGRGPTWVVFPRDASPELKKQDDAKWVWSAIRIEVE
jgi:hypothetical protein